MEMVHPYSNFYNNYGNFNHQNDKPTFHHSNANNFTQNRLFKSNKNLEVNTHTFNFTNIIKNNFNKYDSSSHDLDKNTEMLEFKAGMQDVPAWLKSLRLHKYKLIFSELTYEEMLALTEQQLEEKNVTKGARHKIIVNIDKLRARQSNVVSMEKCVEHEGISGIRQCLNELKTMLQTPIKAFEPSKDHSKEINSQEVADGDLPSQIMKLLEKIFTCLLCDSMRDDEAVNLYLSNCDKVLGHEAFTVFHKQRLLKIKSKLEPFRHLKNGLDSKLNKMKWNGGNIQSPMPLSHLQNSNHFKNISNNTSNANYPNNGMGNSFGSQYNNNNNSNSSLNNLQHYHHPYQNNTKFSNQSNFNSMNGPQQNFFSRANQMNKPNNLVSNNNNNSFSNQTMNNFIKSNDNHKFNVNAECFTSSKSKTLSENNNFSRNGLNKYVNENNGRKLSGNRFMLGGGDNLNELSRTIDEYDKQSNTDHKIVNDGPTKIIAPLSSCSLFNACSQIGKFNKLNNQLNSFDKLNGLESGCLKPTTNQFLFNNLFSDNNLMKCLENNPSMVSSNVFSHEKLESNYETDDFDDKDLLDENHQIYNHIELLSLRMTEQALGSSEFS